MNFRARTREEPEINLIPFIDVLLVVVMAAHIGDKQVRAMGTLGGSVANNDPAACYPSAVLALGASIVTNQRTVGADDFFTGMFATALAEGARAGKESVVIISADAMAAHQSVITVMEAARRMGLSQITFATQSSAQAGGK